MWREYVTSPKFLDVSGADLSASLNAACSETSEEASSGTYLTLISELSLEVENAAEQTEMAQEPLDNTAGGTSWPYTQLVTLPYSRSSPLVTMSDERNWL